ncbi:hypothetical protein CSUI_005054 [Cystoisospora suis]|uniref:Uncharacterized protein n=1 Tax=Cystoisospora suis TaxID=483139 RepID=A0A2C6KYD8_9APIC|nr:hypothetical protein CSUI_005054 [Cystoisospora suis]
MTTSRQKCAGWEEAQDGAASLFQPAISAVSSMMASFSRDLSGVDRMDVHERLYREAEQNRKRRQELDKVDSGSHSTRRRAKPCPTNDDKLYLHAEWKRQHLNELQRRADEQLQAVREAPKLGARSRAIYRKKLLKELRSAVDRCQPDTPGSPTIQASLIGSLFQYMGIFREDHIGESYSQQNASPAESVPDCEPAKVQQNLAMSIVRSLHAQNRLAAEKKLAQKLSEKLDVEETGRIPVDRLFSFLAAVTTEQPTHCRWAVGGCSPQRTADTEGVLEAAKEIHALGTYSFNQGSSTPARPSMETLSTTELRHLQELDKEMPRLIRAFAQLMLTRERKRERMPVPTKVLLPAAAGLFPGGPLGTCIRRRAATPRQICRVLGRSHTTESQTMSCRPCFLSSVSTGLVEAVTAALDGVTFHPQTNPQSAAIVRDAQDRQPQGQRRVSLPDRLRARGKPTTLKQSGGSVS